MIEKINYYAKYYGSLNPWTNVYGFARTIIALGTFLVLIFNSTETLFFRMSPSKSSQMDIHNISLFHLLGDNYLFIGKYLSIFILTLVIVGWRPRVTGIFHWYVSFSLFSASPIIDGGDQITSILTLLLIPVCLTDPRKWHWCKITDKSSNSAHSQFTRLFIWSLFLVIRLQVCIIYLHAAIAKFGVTEWVNGTVTYYWFTNQVHGAATWLRPFVFYLMSKPFFVVFFTWGTLLLELTLAGSLFIDKHPSIRKFLLVCGITFHLGIVLIHGLVSFFFAMAGALILYLYPLSSSIDFKLFKRLWLKVQTISSRVLFFVTSGKTT